MDDRLKYRLSGHTIYGSVITLNIKRKHPEIILMAVEMLKRELAIEMGIDLGNEGYYGHMSCESMGKIGGRLNKRIKDIIYNEFHYDMDAWWED